MPGHDHAAAPGLSTVIAGAYRSLWNGLDMGLTLDGFTMSQSNSGIDITADITGETVIDTIYSGTTLSVDVTLENWNAEAIEPMIWWQGDGVPAEYEWGVTDGVGMSQFDRAKPLMLYACQATGSPGYSGGVVTNPTGAAAANPYIDPLDIVFPRTLLRKDSNLDLLFSFRPRFITLTLDVYPISDTYNETDYDETAPLQSTRVNDCDKVRYFSATRGQGPVAP